MADVFHEVEEELRRDKYNRLFRKYGPYVLAVAIIIVAAAAGNEAWRGYQDQVQGQASVTFAEAMDELEAGQSDAAVATLDALTEGSPGSYGGLALMQQAAALLQQGQRDAAAAKYDEASAAISDPLMRDLARLKAAMVLADVLSRSELEARLQGLTDQNGAFRFIARELAAAAAFKDGDIQGAYEDYIFLSLALEAPQGVRRRAQEALALIEPLRSAAANDSNDNSGVSEAPEGAAPWEVEAPDGEPAPEEDSEP